MSDFMNQLRSQATGGHNQQAALVLKYVNGNDKAYDKLAPEEYQWWVSYAARFLSPPDELDQQEQRFLRAAAKVHALSDVVSSWLELEMRKEENKGVDFLTPFLAAVGKGEEEEVNALAAVIDWLEKYLEDENGKPTVVGKYLLDQSAERLVAATKAHNGSGIPATLRFLLQHQPKLKPEVVPAFLIHVQRNNDAPTLDEKVVDVLLEADPKKYELLILKSAEAHPVKGEAFGALSRLAEKIPEHKQRARQAVAETLQDQTSYYRYDLEACRWLLVEYGVDGLPELCAFMHSGRSRFCTTVLGWALGTINSDNAFRGKLQPLGEKARPLFLAAAAADDAETSLAGIEQLVAWGKKEDQAAIVAAIVKGLENKKLPANDTNAFLRQLAAHDLNGLQEHAWKLLEHKSKPVRMAAARTLGGLGEPAVKRAAVLAAGKKAAMRSAAVALLAAAATVSATTTLEKRVDEEDDDEVRDQILLALEQVWDQQGKKLSRADIDRRVERAKGKMKDAIPSWLNDKKLPPLHFAGKKPEQLSAEQVRYLIYRQSRAKEMRPDVEAKPLFGMLDRATSGDFGLFVLQSFFGSKMEADDRWALSLACLTGDDRCVAAMTQQIRKWVDSNRGKLAEYAAQALALLGSDVALCAVDGLSIRYRSKQKNIGKAATEAFADAAERLGVTPDELGDRVVPWLGFEPGQPRLIEEKSHKIEVRIGLDHKLEYRDLVKGKKINSLPSGISAEVKTEFKDLAATLREVVKGQLARMENLMVRQFRWPLARWQELYLQHPLLFPFATQMIWAVYDEQGKLVKAFRALEDRTLTDEADESVTLPKSGEIGLVHPLELTPAARKAWATHISDYNIAPPVLQITRPVVFAQEDEKAVKMSTKFAETELNGMTFKSRSERLGWQRGSVTDGGGIETYRKSFPGAGADALIETPGMFIGIGVEDRIKLGKLYFVKSGSVTFGSYTYDEPRNEQDERLIPFGQVPPIVFSETMGDLGKISGAKTDEEEEAA